MRGVFTVILLVGLAAVVRGDDDMYLLGLGTYFVERHGVLEVTLEDNQVIWHDGVRTNLPTFTFGRKLDLKVGEKVISGRADGFCSYRLLSLSGERASVEFNSYTAVPEAGTEPRRYRPGTLIEHRILNLRLPVLIFDDSEANRLELGTSSARTK